MVREKSFYAFDSEEDAKKALRLEGRKLKYIAISIWRQYLNSYHPKVYVRTRDSQKAIKLGKVKRLDGNTFGIEVTFDDDLSYHNSIVKGSQKKGHSFMLISEGWNVRKGKHKDIYRFGYYEGFDYINKIKEAYKAVGRKGVDLEVQWNGKEFRNGKNKKVLR